MYRRIFYILLSFFFIYSLFSCKDDKSLYVVKGKLDNVQDTVFFAAREMGDTLCVDTINIDHKGEFIFTGHVDTLTVISLYFKGNSASPYILVDKGWKINIEGDINYPDLIFAQGGEINNELTKFKKDHEDLLRSRRKIIQTEDANREVSDSIANKDYTVELKNINFELQNLASDYVKRNPTKISSVILINSFFKNEESLDRLKESLEELKGIAYDFPLAVQLREYESVTRQSAVGSRAPSFVCKDIDGNEVSLTKMKGQYILLSFLSTTCKVCQEMLPDYIKEYDEIKKWKKNIEFISIQKDVEEIPISDEDKKKIKWKNIPEANGWASKLFEDYNIKAVPYNILISKDGKILERNVSIYGLNKRLDSYTDIKEEEHKENRFKRK